MKSKVVTIPTKFKKKFEDRYIKMLDKSYQAILGGKNTLCEDHFMAPHGCQLTCPFAKFNHKRAGTGCKAWMEMFVERHDYTIAPPYKDNHSWDRIFEILSEEIRTHVVFED